MSRRTFALFLLSAVALASCSGTKKTCATRVTVDAFSMCLADGWEQIQETDLRAKGVPEETIAAFHLTEKRGGQRDNIVVSRENLPGAVSSRAYASANVKAVAGQPEYKRIEQRDVKMGGDVSMLHIFSAKPVPDLPVRRFYQLSLTVGTKGYTFTGTLPYAVENDIEQSLIDMLTSVTVAEGDK